MVSSPGQWRAVAIGLAAVLFSFGLLYIPGFYKKYLLLARLHSPRPYQVAMLGDILGEILLAMALAAIFTTIQWHSLFPGIRDYHVLASYPVRMSDIFIAKFTALLAFAVTLIVSTTLLPSVLLPSVFAGDYAGNAQAQIPAVFISASLGAVLAFLSLTALQGLLINVIPVHQYGAASLTIQGTLLIALLTGLPVAFSLLTPDAIEHPPRWAAWLPPVWFLGLDQVLAGNSDPFALRLAKTAIAALIAGAVAAVGCYWWSYKRHRRRLLETPGQPAGTTQLFERVFSPRRFVRDPRRLGVFVFIEKTLARSPMQRFVFTVFVAIAAALICNSFATLLMRPSGPPVARAWREAAVAAPLALSLFVLAGLRYLFRLPVEHRANWIFRVNQAGNEELLSSAVQQFLIDYAVAPVALLTLPIEIRILGFAAGLEAGILCLVLSLVLMELLLMQSKRIPFTSSYLPGQRPVIQILLIYGAAISVYVSSLAALIESNVSKPNAVALLAVFLSAWLIARRTRKLRWGTETLDFEEEQEPAVFTLDLKRE